jgi:xylan 1,4-beta-xylosidase
MTAWPNPLVQGFNPDPSVVRVDGVYYLVTSTFEYLPGLPVYRSTDLIEWVHVGNAVTRPEQVDIDDVPTPGGVWAPTLRYRDGVFYLIVTVMLGGRGCVVFTATDPAGPWSDGKVIAAVNGIDPDLAWDEDGTAYVTFAVMGRGIQQMRVDLDTGTPLEDPRPMWSGTMYAPEGPHLYRRGDYWYLLIAEGGTERGHAVSIARSPAPDGPFEACPHNPLLTARSTHNPIQNTGHADLVDTPDGRTAMVLLGVRPVGFTQSFSPLGRETFITEVEWVDDWPQPFPVKLAPRSEVEAVRFDFSDAAALDNPGWVAVRRMPTQVASLTAAPGWLSITGDGMDLHHRRPWFFGRRQRHLTATASTRVAVGHGVGGLAARHDEDHWFAIEARTTETGTTEVTARAVLSDLERTWQVELPAGDLELRIELDEPSTDMRSMTLGGDRIRLIAACGGQEVQLAKLDGRYWSFETAKTFTGRVIGLYAVNGTVKFLDFTYRGSNDPAQLPSSSSA